MYHLQSVIVRKTLNTTPIASVISSPLQPIPFFLWYCPPMLHLVLATSVSVFWTFWGRSPLQYHCSFLYLQQELQYLANSSARGLDEMSLNFFKYILQYNNFMKPDPGDAPSEPVLEFESCLNWCSPSFPEELNAIEISFLFHSTIPYPSSRKHMAVSLAGFSEETNTEKWSSHERGRRVKGRVWLCSLTTCIWYATQDQGLPMLTTVWKAPEDGDSPSHALLGLCRSCRWLSWWANQADLLEHVVM